MSVKNDWEGAFKEEKVHLRTEVEQLAWADNRLSSMHHHQNTPTTYYGIGNPERFTVSPCICGYPILPWVRRNEPTNQIITYQVFCKAPGCNRSTSPLSKATKAITTWNLSKNSKPVEFSTIQYFGLSAIEPRDVTNHLGSIINDLKLKIFASSIRRRVSTGQGFGLGYEIRLKSYLEHAVYALALFHRSHPNIQTAADDDRPVTPVVVVRQSSFKMASS